jgi:branched-chain amino acid transport system permease protein
MSVNALILGIVTGLALASVYVLIAISVTLVLAVSGIFNFAQGSIVMLGTILSFVLGVQLSLVGPVVVLIIAAAGVLGGLLTYLVAVYPAIGRSNSFAHTAVLTTIGFGTVANAIAALLFGADTYRVPSYVSDSPVYFFSIALRPTYLIIIAIGFTLTLAIEWMVRRTRIGHVFRTTLEDPEGAEILGINTRKVIIGAFCAAGGLSALAGYLVAPIVGASAFTAQDLAFYGFAGMTIGGFGSFAGALVGGLVVGLLGGLLPTVALDPHLTLPLTWLTAIAVLLVRPAGLWGAAGLFGSARLRDV